VVRSARMLTTVLLFAVALSALGGCSRVDSPLDGTRWRLSEWTLNSLDPAELKITAEFAEGKISGSSGVNTYSGPYRVGPSSAFSVGPLASTEMAGSEPAMRAEQAYLTLLGQVGSFKMADGRLTLYDAGGNESLLYEAQK
jgi:heat shock protein HslJ